MLVLDDQLSRRLVQAPIRKWAKVVYLRDLRPGEQVLDDRVPEILLQLKRPTFVTIDQGFWDRTLGHAHYAILCFAIADEEQQELPEYCAVLRLPQFHSRAGRMGKVVRITHPHLEWWDVKVKGMRRLVWTGPKGKRTPE